MKEKTLFIFNPNAGNGKTEKLLPVLKSILKNKANFTEILNTEFVNHATKLVEGLQEDFGRIIVVGGDGTLNEALNGLNNDFRTVLGVIPAGSGNDFAKTAGMSANFEKNVIFAMNCANASNIDFGEIEYSEFENEKIKRRFINSAGIGFDALVSDIKNQSTRLQGLPQYIFAIFKALKKFHYIGVNSEFDSIEDIGKKLLIAVSNGKTYGGGIKVNPNAEIDDGYLDACIINPMPLTKILMNLHKFVAGTHDSLKEIKLVRFISAGLSIPEGAFIHADGEVIASGAREITIKVHPKRLRFILNHK